MLVDGGPKFLEIAYDASRADPAETLNVNKVAKKAHLTEVWAATVCNFLRERELIQISEDGLTFSITVKGIDYIENLRPNPAVQEDREELLHASRDASRGDASAILSLRTIGDSLGWSQMRTRRAFHYLCAKGFLHPCNEEGKFTLAQDRVAEKAS